VGLLLLAAGVFLVLAGCLGLVGCVFLGLFPLQPGPGFPPGTSVERRQGGEAPEGQTPANPMVRFGMPGPAAPGDREHHLIDRPQYVLSYNGEKLIPNWVSWRLVRENIGNVPRQPFEPDPDLPRNIARVTAHDYDGSGFDRGHMCPAKDRSATEEDSKAVFFMTNIVPQSPNSNQKGWERLEDYCRRLAQEGHALYIACGPAGVGGEGKNGPAEVIGKVHRITVPAKLWKVVLVLPREDAQPRSNSRVIAAIMPNDQSVGFDWTKYRTSARKVEALTGLRFFSAAPDDVAEALRDHVDEVEVRVGEPRQGRRGEREPRPRQREEPP
jgi:endonuclease G